MENTEFKISLGFSDQEFQPGVHICQIFSDDKEREDALLQFLLQGLSDKEKSVCFTEKLTDEKINAFFSEHKLNYKERKEKGDINVSETSSVYFSNNEFDPDRMVNTLRSFYETSQKEGYKAARVIGEMSPTIEKINGGERLMEYESKITRLLRTHPLTAVCQYDASTFDGKTIMEVLKVHPLMIVKGRVVHNPYYTSPEEVLQD